MLIKCQFVIQTDLLRLCSTNKQHIHFCSINLHQLRRAVSTPLRELSSKDLWSPFPDSCSKRSRTGLSLTSAKSVLEAATDGVSPPPQLPRSFDSPFPSGTSEAARAAWSLLPFSIGVIVWISNQHSLPQQSQPFKGDTEGSAVTLAGSSLVGALRSWSCSAFGVSRPTWLCAGSPVPWRRGLTDVVMGTIRGAQGEKCRRPPCAPSRGEQTQVPAAGCTFIALEVS